MPADVLQRLLGCEGVKLEFTPEAIQEIAAMAEQINKEVRAVNVHVHVHVLPTGCSMAEARQPALRMAVRVHAPVRVLDSWQVGLRVQTGCSGLSEQVVCCAWTAAAPCVDRSRTLARGGCTQCWSG